MAKRNNNQVVVVDPLTTPDSSDVDIDHNVDSVVVEPVTVAEGLVPVELTEDQQRIRILEDQLARERGGKDPELELVVPTQPGAVDNIVIHILEDGLTALGQVWYRGQELEFEPGSPAFEDTRDRNGRSWLDLRGDDFGQVERWGKVMFRPGPWPGKSLTAAAAQPYTTLKSLDGATPVPGPSEEELATAAATEARRGRAAPRLPAR